MKTYPLVFSFRDTVVGNGFVAGVVATGRVLLTEEDDGDIWMYGVQPGGIAGGAQSRDAAFREFKENYLSVLFDIAAEESTYAGFKNRVEVFFAEVNGPNAEDWTDLHSLVKRGSISMPDLVRVDAAVMQPSLEVILLDQKQSKPTVNQFDEIAQAA